MKKLENWKGPVSREADTRQTIQARRRTLVGATRLSFMGHLALCLFCRACTLPRARKWFSAAITMISKTRRLYGAIRGPVERPADAFWCRITSTFPLPAHLSTALWSGFTRRERATYARRVLRSRDALLLVSVISNTRTSLVSLFCDRELERRVAWNNREPFERELTDPTPLCSCERRPLR